MDWNAACICAAPRVSGLPIDLERNADLGVVPKEKVEWALAVR